MFTSALTCAFVLMAQSAGPDLSELAKALKKSVVGIEADRGQKEAEGSGFVIREAGWVVTNHHVIKDATTLRVVTVEGERIDVEGIVGQSEKHDLAILKIKKAGLPALALGDSATAEQGSRVVLLGNPVGLGFSLSEGIVSAVRDNGIPSKDEKRPSWKQRLIQTTAPISPGSSGSPAVNLDRQVVGVAMGIDTGGQNIGFLVPVERLKELIAEIEAGMASKGGKTAVRPLQPVGAFPVVNLVISLILFGGLLALGWWLRRPKKPKAAGGSKSDFVN